MMQLGLERRRTLRWWFGRTKYIGVRDEDDEEDRDDDEDKDLEDPRNCMSRLVCVRSAHLPPWCQPSSTILRQITQFKGYSCHHHHQDKLTCYHTTQFFTNQHNLRKCWVGSLSSASISKEYGWLFSKANLSYGLNFWGQAWARGWLYCNLFIVVLSPFFACSSIFSLFWVSVFPLYCSHFTSFSLVLYIT